MLGLVLELIQRLLASERLMRAARPLFGRFHPFLPEYRRDPHPSWKALRESEPVYWSRVFRAWMLTRYDDCLHVLRDKNFTTDRSGVPMMKLVQRMTRGDAEFRALVERNLLTTDGEVHRRLRGLVSKAFTPRRVEALRPRIQAIADDLLDRAAEQDEIELVRDFAYPLPLVAIAELLGVPVEDRELFTRLSKQLVQLLDPFQGSGGSKGMRDATRELFAYFRPLLAARRAEPRDDLLSAMIDADELDLLALSSLLLVAGHETTSNLIANAVVALLRYPDERKRLADEPVLLPTAVDEFLRFDGPIILTDRAVIEDCEIGGKPIRGGQMVAVCIMAADRDPARFADPDRLDVGRTDNHHLAFGQGNHYCLGAQLAKLETELAIGTLLRRFPDFSGEPEPPAWRRSMIIRGPEALPIRLGA
jgi:cytochrome P450